MKILMLTTSMDIGGAETHIAELCRGLRSMGHTAEVVSAGGKYADTLAGEGIVQHTLPLNKKDPASIIRCLRGLTDIIKNGNYDIVHAHARIPGVICGALHKKLGFRFVTTAHLDFKVNALWRLLTKWGERTMAVSDDLVEYLVREYDVPREQVSVTVNGINMGLFAPSTETRQQVRSEYGIPYGNKLIVYISRLDEDRSAPAKLLCSAMPKICETYPNTTLLIVGDGNDMDNVRAAAASANGILGEESVILAGARYDIYRFAAAADVFCGVSRSALEAMAAKCPVILSGNQGHTGIFTEDCLPCAIETNFCCRGCSLPTEELLIRDVTALFGMTDEELSKLGEYNHSVVAERYSLEKMTADYVRMYESLAGTPLFQEAEAVISGYFGYGNSGDDTALDCLAAAIRQKYPDAQIAVLSREPKKFGKAHNLIGIGRYDLPAMLKVLRGARLFISGGGSLLQNATSCRSLLYYAGMIHLAKACGARVFICANGIGPLKGRFAERVTYGAVMKADRVSVRDTASKETLVRLGVPSDRVFVTADPAFRLVLNDVRDVSHIRQRIGMRDGERYFAVSLRRGTCDEQRVRELCRACRDIYLRLGLTPVFVSMQEAEDRELCRMIAEETCGEAIAVPHLPTEELCSLISGMELVLSMRLHLMIYAAVSGTPAVGISVDPKMDAAAAVLDSAEFVTGNCFTAEELVLSAEKAILADRHELRRIAFDQAHRAAEDAMAAVRMMRDYGI